MHTKINRIIIPIIIVAVLIVSFFIFMKPKDEVEETLPTDEKTEITMSIMGMGDDIDDEFMRYVEEKFDVEITLLYLSWSTWRDSLQKLRITDELPDVFTSDMLGYSLYDDWVNSGIIQTVVPDESLHNNLYEYMQSDYIKQFLDENGDIYAIPRMGFSDEENFSLTRYIVLREDIVEDMGYSMPTSYQEFEELLYEFVHIYHPSKTGEKGKGLLVENLNKMEAVFLGVYPELSNLERGWIEEDGLVIPVYTSQNMGDALNMLQNLYREGLMDELFYQRTSLESLELFINGESLAFAIPIDVIIENWNALGGPQGISDYVEIMRPWPLENGDMYRFTTTSHWSEIYINSTMDEQKTQKILSILDYTISEEFINDISDFNTANNPSINFLGKTVMLGESFMYHNYELYPDIYPSDLIEELHAEEKWFVANTKTVPYFSEMNFLQYPGKEGMPSNQQVHSLIAEAILGDESAGVIWERSLSELYSEHNIESAILNANKHFE